MNHTPEKSGVMGKARDFIGFGCGVFCAPKTNGRTIAAAKRAKMKEYFRTLDATRVSNSARFI
jgi:hypothetical protein